MEMDTRWPDHSKVSQKTLEHLGFMKTVEGIQECERAGDDCFKKESQIPKLWTIRNRKDLH